MPFRVSRRTLARLEWPEVVARLRAHAATPRGRARCSEDETAGADAAPPDERDAAAAGGAGGDTKPAGDDDAFRADAFLGADLFQGGAESARERLAGTSEARELLDRGEAPPVGGVADVDPSLRRAAKGGVLAARELQDVGGALAALTATRRFFTRRAGEAPRLAELAGGIADLRDLEEDLAFSIDRDGELRDDASPALAAARRDVRDLSSSLQQRLAAYLRDPGVSACLSDSFYTVRNDRYVLPVRAGARGRVRGIVHDASASGTTLFIEPEAVVEVNNRLKTAEIAIERETLRLLRDLTRRVVAEIASIDESLHALAEIDLAIARGRLSREMDAVAPEVRDAGVFDLRQLRHPLLPPGSVVANDLRLGDGPHVLVLSGPNAGGKTVAMKALALAALFVRAGLHVPALPGSRADLVDAVLADIGDEQSLRESLSTFSAHMAGLSRIVRAATPRSLVVLDEIGDGTDPGEGAALAQSVLEALAERGARVVATTHYNLLKEMAAVDARFENASVDFDPETLAPTYRLRLGVPGGSSATAVAARMGLPASVLDRANELLEREDRRLDRMLAELAASRAALETERREAGRLRRESESARAEYRHKLERLAERRDKLFASLRADLESAFKDAHTQVAAVIRDLQRGGGARDAAHARERLIGLERRAAEAEREIAGPPPPEAHPDPVDWRRARPGDRVRVRDGGEGTLLALPDKRGRAAVRVGAARLLLPAERLAAAHGAAAKAPVRPTRVRVEHGPETAAERGLDTELDALRCDLRGLRVEEAIDRVVFALDRAASARRPRVILVHGGGTGALRDAVRRHLRESPYVERFGPGEPAEGGNGVTVAVLG